MGKYLPCPKCEKRPRCYREDGVWYLDHYCSNPHGSLFLGAYTVGQMIKLWNEKVLK